MCSHFYHLIDAFILQDIKFISSNIFIMEWSRWPLTILNDHSPCQGRIYNRKLKLLLIFPCICIQDSRGGRCSCYEKWPRSDITGFGSFFFFFYHRTIKFVTQAAHQVWPLHAFRSPSWQLQPLHTCKKREIPEIYLRNFFWIFRKILGWEREINTAPKPSPEIAPSKMEVAPS